MTRLGSQELARPALWRVPDKETDNDGHWTGPALLPLRPNARNNAGTLDLGRYAVAQDQNVAPEHLVFTRPGMNEGEYWLTRASFLGLPEARTALGLAQLDGITLPLNTVEGVWLLTSAACDMDHRALAELSQYWVDRAPLRAWVFAELTAKAGTPMSPDFWDHLTKTIPPRQIGRAKQIVQDWCGQD